MNTRTTHWLLGIATALALFILLFERRAPSDTARERAASLLLPRLDPRTVRTLEIRAGTNPVVTLERGADTWQFRAPFDYPAQPERLQEFLGRLAAMTIGTTVEAAEVRRQTNGLAAFGLAPPTLALTLTTDDGRTTLELSRPSPIGGQLYARRDAGEQLVTVDAALLGLFPPSFDRWRETRIANLGRLTFDRLLALPLTNGFEVVRAATNRTWSMTKPLPTRANSARLEHLLQELDLLRVARFLPDPTSAELESQGLLPPRRELIFARGTNDILNLQIGLPHPVETNLVHLRLMTHSNVVLAPRSGLWPWLEGFTNFCDTRLMIFDPDLVRRIEIQADESFAVERGTNGSWQIVQPFTAPADPVLVLECLAEMAALEFLGFEREVTTDFASYGLDPPRRHFTLLTTVTNAAGPTNLPLARVDFGSASGHRYFARRSREDSVVLALDPVRLPAAAFRLRDRRLWQLQTNDLTAITIRADTRTRRLVRTGPMQWVAAEGSGPPPNPVTLEEAAFRVGRLWAERWVARGEESLAGYGILTGGHEVTLETRSSEPATPYRVRFGRRAASGRTYAAVTLPPPVGTVIFECPASVYEFVLTDLSLPPAAATPGP